MNRMFSCGAAIIIAMLATPAFAGEIDGSVRDASGVAVAGVEVRVRGLDAVTVTDEHGHFHFDSVPPGEHVVEVGDEGVAESVTVGDGISDVRIRLATVTLDRVVVRATPLRGRSPLDMARPVSVLAGDELTRKNAASIGETVAAELGMSATAFGQGASRPVIRGLGDDRVRVLDGGIGTLDVSSVSDDHGIALEPILVDQIEILRGPATLLYGTGAIGGVVNVIDNRIPERLPAHAIEGRIELRGQSVNDERAGVLRLDGRLTPAVAWHFDMYRRRTADFSIPGYAESDALRALEDHDDDHDDDHDEEGEEIFGSVPNSDLTNQGANVGLSWIGQRGFVGFAVSTMDKAYGIPGGHGHHDEEHHDDDHDEEEEHHDEDDEAVRIDLRQTRFDVAGALDDPLPGFERLRFRFGRGDYEHVELEDGAVGTVFRNDAWEARAELTHAPIGGGWHGAIGIQVSGRDFSAIGAEAFTPPVESEEFGVFFVEERDFGVAKVELGARAERVGHDPSAGPSRNFHLASFSSGLIVPFAGNFEGVFTLGRFERAPVAEELYSDGPHLATGTYEVGDPDLRGERSNAVELGLRNQFGDLRWSVSAFRNAFDHYIHLQDAGVEDAESGLPIHRYVQQDAVFTGIEAELEGILVDAAWARIDFRLFMDTVRATLADDTPVPRIPPRRYGFSLEFTRAALSAGIDWTRYDSQSRIAPGELATPGYTMLNADLGYRLSTGAGEWLLFLRGSNLLDEDARRHTSFLKDVVPLPGRSIQVGARLSF
jgi:iron complex outermembrane recepter protein